MNARAPAYGLWIGGAVDVDELNTLSPCLMQAVHVTPTASLCAVQADQAGLIGLLRHLHGLGLTLLCVWRIQEPFEMWRNNACEYSFTPPVS